MSLWSWANEGKSNKNMNVFVMSSAILKKRASFVGAICITNRLRNDFLACFLQSLYAPIDNSWQATHDASIANLVLTLKVKYIFPLFIHNRIVAQV